MHSIPMVAVRNIRASAAWYCSLLGCNNEEVAEDFDRLVDQDRVLLLLHAWGAEEHGTFKDPGEGVVGHGFLLWIGVDDIDAVYRRAQDMDATIVKELHANPEDRSREFTTRDPDGYHVAITSPEA